jgi:hypothetical protein
MLLKLSIGNIGIQQPQTCELYTIKNSTFQPVQDWN